MFMLALSLRAGPSALVQNGDRLDLDRDPGRELAHLYQRAGGESAVEGFLARLPDLLAIADVGDEDGELDDVTQRSARGLHERTHAAEDQLRLRILVAAGGVQ